MGSPLRFPAARAVPRRAAKLALVLAFVASACSEKTDPLSSGSLRDRLDSNWGTWQSWTEPDYAFDFQWNCFCLPELTAPVRVQVVGHLVTGVIYRDDGTPIDPDFLPLFPTIAQLFLTIENAIEDDADVIRVEFHGEHGYPVFADLDYDAQAADDELGFMAGNVSLGAPAVPGFPCTPPGMTDCGPNPIEPETWGRVKSGTR